MLKKAFLALAFVGVSLAAFAQSQQTGNLVGTVTDKNGDPMPGVTVYLQSEALIQDRTVFTNENGNYKAGLLPPGSYTATFSMAGLQTVKHQFEIKIGGTSKADAILVVAIEDVIQVVGHVSELETDTVGVHLDADTVDKLPMPNRNMQAIVAKAPGISVGPTGNYQISGAQSSDSSYLLNGADISSPYYGQDQSLYIEEAIQETQVMVGDVSARYGRFTGGVINSITKSGSNTFEGSLRLQLTNQKWNAQNPWNTARGVEPSDQVNKLYQATLGGPVIKDRLWFFLATQVIPDTANNLSTLSGETVTNQRSDDMYQGKLTWGINPSHTLALDYLWRDQESSGGSNPFVLGSSRAAGTRSDHRELLTLNYTGILTPSLYLDVTYTEMDNTINNGGDAANGHPVLDARTFTIYNNFWWSYDDTDVRSNETLSADLNYFTETSFGRHDMHLGFQSVNSITGGLNQQSVTGTNILFGYNWGARDSQSISNISGFDSNNEPIFNLYGSSDVELWVANPFPDGQAEMKQTALYLEDEWTINDHWRTRIGVRYDKYDSSSPLQDGAVDDNAISPRFSLTYDVRGDSSLKFNLTGARYVGRINDNVSNVASGIGNAPANNYRYIGPNLLNLTTNELNNPTGAAAALFNPENWSIFGANSPDVSVLSDDLSAPYSEEFTLGMKRSWGRNGWLEVTAVSRDFHNMYEDFTGGFGQIVLEDGSLLDITRWQNVDHERKYRALMLSFGKSGANWQIGGQTTISSLRGNYEGEAASSPGTGSQFGDYAGLQDLTYSYAEGPLVGDEPLRSRIWGYRTFDFGGAGSLNVGLQFDYSSGTPYSKSVSVDIDGEVREQTLEALGYASSANTSWRYFDGGRRGQMRFNDNYDLDLSLRYDLSFFRVNWFAKVDVLNLLNRKELRTFNTSMNLDSGGEYGLYADGSGNLNYALTAPSISLGSRFGQPTGTGNFTSIRTVQLTTGLKF